MDWLIWVHNEYPPDVSQRSVKYGNDGKPIRDGKLPQRSAHLSVNQKAKLFVETAAASDQTVIIAVQNDFLRIGKIFGAQLRPPELPNGGKDSVIRGKNQKLPAAERDRYGGTAAISLADGTKGVSALQQHLSYERIGILRIMKINTACFEHIIRDVFRIRVSQRRFAPDETDAASPEKRFIIGLGRADKRPVVNFCKLKIGVALLRRRKQSAAGRLDQASLRTQELFGFQADGAVYDEGFHNKIIVVYFFSVCNRM